jgi:hypothetical protein
MEINDMNEYNKGNFDGYFKDLIEDTKYEK